MARATISVKLEGGEELIRKLRAMDRNVSDELEAAVRRGAEPILTTARARAPGPEIQMEVTEKTGKRVTVDIGPDDEHWYYRFFETGAGPHELTGSPLLVFEGESGLVFARGVSHPGMAAEPFLRPAFDMKRRQAEREVGGHLKRVVERGT
jgi:HK97 gp10 family phage protein